MKMGIKEAGGAKQDGLGLVRVFQQDVKWCALGEQAHGKGVSTVAEGFRGGLE